MTQRRHLDDFVIAYRALQNATPTLRWATPANVVGHQQLLERLIGDERVVDYPATFEMQTSSIEVPREELAHARALAERTLTGTARAFALESINGIEEIADALTRRDGVRYTAVSVARYGMPSATVCAWAERLLAERRAEPEKAGDLLDATQLAQAVRQVLAANGLRWDVVVTAGMASRMSTSGADRRLRIRADATFSPRDAKRLIAHEIGGHVFRWENAWRQAEPLLSLPLGDTTPTEEGLALLAERECGVQRDLDLHIYAGRAIAVRMAAEHGILEVARALSPWLGPTLAASAAIRVKRGLTDPNEPGGLTKDHAYLSGLHILEQLAAEDIRLLRATKWPLDLIEELRGRRDRGEDVAARYVPDASLLRV